MIDVTNSPATPMEWKDRYIQMLTTDPEVMATRDMIRKMDPTTMILNNQDVKGWLEFLKVKRAKGLVLDGPEPIPVMPRHLYVREGERQWFEG